MAARTKRKRAAPKVESLQADSTLVGLAFEMPDLDVGFAALGDEAPIDFQAREDSISPTRRGPGPKLAPKLKRTTMKPARAKETIVEL